MLVTRELLELIRRHLEGCLWEAAKYNESWYNFWNENSMWNTSKEIRAFTVTIVDRKGSALEAASQMNPSNMQENQQGLRLCLPAKVRSGCIICYWNAPCCRSTCCNLRVQRRDVDLVPFSRALHQCLRPGDEISATLLSVVYNCCTPGVNDWANNLWIINQSENMLSNRPYHDSELCYCYYTLHYLPL